MAFTTRRDKDAWDWIMMIMQPEWISEEVVRQTAKQAEKKGLLAPGKMRLESYEEGLSAQIMHVGSYDDEGPVPARLHSEWMPENGYVENSKHHEIYVGDPRRVAPEKLRTVLRQPVRKA